MFSVLFVKADIVYQWILNLLEQDQEYAEEIARVQLLMVEVIVTKWWLTFCQSKGFYMKRETLLPNK